MAKDPKTSRGSKATKVSRDTGAEKSAEKSDKSAKKSDAKGDKKALSLKAQRELKELQSLVDQYAEGGESEEDESEEGEDEEESEEDESDEEESDEGESDEGESDEDEGNENRLGDDWESIDEDEDEDAEAETQNDEEVSDVSGDSDDSDDSDESPESPESAESAESPESQGVKPAKFTRVGHYNKKAMDAIAAKLEHGHGFLETLVLTYPESVTAEANDDLQREAEFYKAALWAANEGEKRFKKANVPFARPADFFAEMVKSDAHMARVRKTMLDERAALQAQEDARKQRQHKKYAKEVQQNRLRERKASEKAMNARVDEFKKRKRGAPGLEDFDADIEDAISGKKPKMSREARNERYGGKGGVKKSGKGGKRPGKSQRKKR